MANCKISFTSDQNSEEHGGAEAHVVEGVGELGDEVNPNYAVLRPGPTEH